MTCQHYIYYIYHTCCLLFVREPKLASPNGFYSVSSSLISISIPYFQHTIQDKEVEYPFNTVVICKKPYRPSLSFPLLQLMDLRSVCAGTKPFLNKTDCRRRGPETQVNARLKQSGA